MNNASPHKKYHKPRGRKPHGKNTKGLVIAAISFISVLAILLIGSGIYIWRLFGLVKYNTGDNSVSYVDSLIPEEDVGGNVISDYTFIEEGAENVAEIPIRQNTKSVTNILLIGIDTRKNNYSGLADTTMILTINSKNKSIKLTSILRDTLVTIPGRDRNGDGKDDYAKFNASYAYGGFDLLSKTIEQNFRLKIDKYITINFQAFSDVVDAMGGINIDLTEREARHLKVGSTAKTYSLNGKKALDYARIRKLDSDFGRTNRQRKVMGILFQKAKKMSIAKLNSILNQVLPRVETNMSPNEFTGYIFNSYKYFGYKMDETYHVPPNGGYKGDSSIPGLGQVLVLTDPAATVTELHKFIYT